jgi:tetratricopeptide (TPR) repeat protein
MEAAAKTALELDPSLAEAQLAAYWVAFYRYDVEGALSRTARAVELSPGDCNAHVLRAQILAYVGRFDEALQSSWRAQVLDPVFFNHEAWASLGLTYYFMRRYDDAIAFFKQWLPQNPGSDPGHAVLALSYSMKGMHAEALAQNDSCQFFGAINRPLLLAKAARTGLAKEAFEKERSNIDSYDKAAFFALIGEKDSAFQSLSEFYKEPNGMLLWLPHDPYLDNLRVDPRYNELLRKMNVPY